MATFRTTEGLDVIIRPVSMMLIQRIRQTMEQEKRVEGWKLDPPTYTIETASGGHETHPHDEESVAGDPAAAEALASYQRDTAALEQLINRKTQRIVFTKGLKVDAAPEEWVAEMAELGIPVDPDPEKRRLEYIQMELLKTPSDIKGVIQAIIILSMAGSPREDLDAVMATFRDSLEGSAATGDNAVAA